ncbi:MAG: YeeE/YedE family protein, partial [Thermoplasmata archaeon]|nr:YeeE/YedE family protein [Candidatus Sysuiplasma superficiale]
MSFTAPLWVGIFIGAIIGALAELWGISNSDVLLRLSKWEDRLFINCIAIAVGVGAVALYGLAALGVSFHYGIKPDYVVGVALGGIIFGVGIAVSGYVPGTEWMALGEGRREAVYAVAGGLLGAASWTLLYQTPAGRWLVNTYNFGQIYLGGKVGTNLL